MPATELRWRTALLSILDATFHDASPLLRSLLSTTARRVTWRTSAHQVAADVGLGDRYRLAHRLKAEGLPPLRELTAWVRVLLWVVAWEQSGTSLAQQASREGRYASQYYREVRRVTGLGWYQVRERGSGWVLTELRKRWASSETAAAAQAG